jgi:hypothetical protein
MEEIPDNCKIECPTCGKILDKRDPGQILSHGWMNKETGQYECPPDDGKVDIPYTSSHRVGDSIEWSKDKESRHLN